MNQERLTEKLLHLAVNFGLITLRLKMCVHVVWCVVWLVVVVLMLYRHPYVCWSGEVEYKSTVMTFCIYG